MSRFFTCSLLFAMLALTSCMDAPSPQRPAQVSFKQYSPFTLDVAEVEVVNAYPSPLSPPNVEHQFPTPPAEAMKIWVNDRIRAMGTSRKLEVTIKDASVKETSLERTKGLKGAFTNDQAKRFDARLEVEMRIYGTSPLSEASLNIVATRSDTLAENASPIDRERLFARITQSLMDTANAELEKNFYQYFNNYLSAGM